MAGEGQKQASTSPQPPAAARSSPTEASRSRQEARERSQRVHGLCSLSPFAQRVKGHIGEHAPGRAQRRVGHGL